MDSNQSREGLLPVGTMLSGGKYRIDQHLSSGGFGNTYVATDTAFDEKVAIKELFIKGVCGRMDDSTNISISLTENQRTFEAQQNKFRKEARRLRKLSNPHIVGVHNLFDENGTSYYVMDFINGENLSARVKRTRRPLSEADLMLIVPQVLDALGTVHDEGIWHLDLKPGNIMVDGRGNVVLIDFGASKQLHSADGKNATTSSALAYTPGYAPGEQIEQKMEKFGPWTDLYALGATMYYLLTLQQPPSPTDIDEKPEEAFAPLQKVSQKTYDLIVWLMKPNRTMRPQSVDDVKQYLTEVSGSAQSARRRTPASDSEETVQMEKKPQPAAAQKPAAKKPGNGGKSPARLLKPMLVGAVCVFVIGGGILWFNGKGGGAKSADDTVVTDSVPMKQVTDLPIAVTAGPESMRSYLYTGEIADSIGALPEGEGKAYFSKSKSTYIGRFSQGLCDDQTGEATLELGNGDKYKGTFKAGFYAEGVYTMSDGSYFKGTYKNAQPYNGKWYNADNSFSADVVNGVEQ